MEKTKAKRGYKALRKWLIWERKQEKKMGCLMPKSNNMAEIKEVEDVPLLLLPCAICGRTFKPEVLAKHGVVCEKQHTKKRRKFDSAKQRIQGTDLQEFLGVPPLVTQKPKPPSPKKPKPVSKWKEKHEALVKTIRDEPTNKPPDHSQCPYCERYFGPKAHERHVAWCKEQHSKIQVQTEDVSKAKERLQARTKYRAPLSKSQRTLTKEKYSPARLPVKALSSSTFNTVPSDNLSNLHRNMSSSSVLDMGSSGGLGYKSPALSRKNSIPRSIKRFDKEPKRDMPSSKHEDFPSLTSNNSAVPTLAKLSRANSLSSQGSDSRSGSSNQSMSGNLDATAMSSAATSTPVHETKPAIKGALGASSLNRRWSPNSAEQVGGSNTEDNGSKFCHECGGRYPVPGAKFCCLCGVRRLAI